MHDPTGARLRTTRPRSRHTCMSTRCASGWARRSRTSWTVEVGTVRSSAMPSRRRGS